MSKNTKDEAKETKVAPMTNEPKAAERSSGESDSRETIADGWITIVLLVAFLTLCLSCWYLTKREATPGAPGAPVGVMDATGK